MRLFFNKVFDELYNKYSSCQQGSIKDLPLKNKLGKGKHF